MLSWVEHEKSFITSGPGNLLCSGSDDVFIYLQIPNGLMLTFSC